MLDGIVPLGMISDTNQMISALGTGFEVKGVVAATSDLPDSGELGDLYLVSGEGYASYTWSGTEWVLKDGDIATTSDINSALYS